MADPLVVLVLIAPIDATDPTTRAMTSATEKSLAGDAMVVVTERAAPTDEEALALGERVHATAVAVVSWADTEHLKATIHVHRAEGWFDRRYTFSPNDAKPERGQTMGLVLASMLVGSVPDEPTTAKEPAVAPPTTPPSYVVAPPPPSPMAEVASAPSPRSVFRWGVEALAAGGLGGDATSAGVAFAARREIVAGLLGRVSGGMRFGQIEGARSNQLSLGAGLAARAWTFGAFEVGVRSDVLLLRQLVERHGMSRERWLPAVDVLMEAMWTIVGASALVATVGAEAAFGDTPVVFGARRVGNLPILRGVAEIGFRVHF